MASARIRAWRSAFGVLRRDVDANAAAAAVQELLQQAPALARLPQDLSSQEVIGDILFLVDLVFKAPSDFDCSRLCRLVADFCCSPVQLDFKPASSLHVSRFLRSVIDCSSPSANDSVLEAVNALAYFIHANGQHLSSEEANDVLLCLVPLMGYHNWQKDSRTRRGSGLDCVFVAVANTFTRAGSLINQATWKITVQAFRKVLDHVGVHPLEDAAASRYYATVLRSLHLVLSDAKGSLDDNVPGLVASLRIFIGYGLPESRLKNGASHTSTPIPKDVTKNKGSSLYRPPHLRGRSQDNAESSGTTTEESEKRAIFSDSEQSDNDGFENDYVRSSKARTNAILSIQAIARADPKSLHAHWSLLLPTYNVLQPRLYQPTLLTTLLFDPALKTRAAAASAVAALLEGPARAFLQVAEYKDSGKTTGSYTTLSSSLGQIIVELYKGLLHSVTNECHSGVLLSVFKSLSLLVSSSPFDRLPLRLLNDVIRTVHKKLRELPSSADQIITVSGLSCLSAALSASSGFSEVVDMLLDRLPDSEKSILLELITLAKLSSSSAVRIEALQVLKAAIHSHCFLASLYWNKISELLQEIIQHDYASCLAEINNHGFGKAMDDKTVFHALKLLDESLRAISGFKGADEAFDMTTASPSSYLLQQNSTSVVPNLDELQLDIAAHNQWLEAMNEFLPQALQHPGPMVRAAALTCFAGLTASVYSNMVEAHQTYILSTVINAAVQDETPAVRSAACRALGVVVGCNEVVQRKERLRSAIVTVQATVSDAALSVRITSCWALANICDSFCKSSETGVSVACDSESLNTLADIALKAAKDGDKVRANAVRALGNLAKFVDFSEPGTAHSWLGRMVQTLVSCITTGNVKVQWNVCHAMGNLFLNKSIRLSTVPWSSSVFSILLLLLRDSGNFKIRIHAAAALAVPSSRDDFGESFGDVLHGLIHALESLDSERSPPSSFKYISTLSEQLTTTCLRVLSFALPEDYNALKDFLHKRATFLFNWLQSSSAKAIGSCETTCHDGDRNRIEAVGRSAEALSKLFEYAGEKSLGERFHKVCSLVLSSF